MCGILYTRENTDSAKAESVLIILILMYNL